MTNLFRNSSPGALTREQAVALAKKRMAERHRQMRRARELAAQGRGEDTEVAHVARGEFVVPETLQTPEVLDALHQAAAAHNIPLERFLIGHAKNSVNPHTGAPEFFGPLFDPNHLAPAVDATKTWMNRVRQKAWDAAMEGQAYVAKPFESVNPVATVFPPGAPPTSAPSNGDLGYDPNGPSLVGVIKNDPSGAVSALWHAGRAWHEANDRFEGPSAGTLHNGDGDAWKHARWNQRMANAIGADRAKVFADWNERQYGTENPVGEQAMDLFNNQIGRNLAGDNSTLTIDELLRSGRLRTRPYNSN